MLGLREMFRYVQTRHEFILLDKSGIDTDISIACSGADNPETLKGIQPKSGSYWCLWVEEATNFNNIYDIKNIESTVGRGNTQEFISILTYNPRQNSGHFLNKEYENIVNNIGKAEIDDETHWSKYINFVDVDGIKFWQCICHCTYKHLIKCGMGSLISPTDMVDIKIGEESNSAYYRWYYLGEVGTMSDVNVFNNIKHWDGDVSKLNIKKIDRGLDTGSGGQDPFAYVESYYDKSNKELYIINEYVDKGGDTVISRVADSIKRINPHNISFYIDSAVPLIGDMLRKEKLNAIPVKKYQGSVEAGIIWLQSLKGIYINKIKTPVAYKEFSEYEYIIDKYDEVTNELPDKNNHTIDAVRYGNYNNIRL